jgi:hypothetical protein
VDTIKCPTFPIYEVEYYETSAGQGRSKKKFQIGSANSDIKLTDLKPCTKYTFKSGNVIGIFITDPKEPNPIGDIRARTNLNAITLTWTRP